MSKLPGFVYHKGHQKSHETTHEILCSKGEQCKVNEYNNVKWGAGQKVLKSSVDRIKSSGVERTVD